MAMRFRSSGPLLLGPAVFLALACGGGMGEEHESTGGNQQEIAADYVCSEVLGFSQTQQWVRHNNFAAKAGDSYWQSRTVSGSAVDLWADCSFSGYTTQIYSSCASKAQSPTRMVFTVSGDFGDDVALWRANIEQAVSCIRQNRPSALKIFIQPVVGPPLGQSCIHSESGQEVRASYQHRYIQQAIAQVIAADTMGDLVQGAQPRVQACNRYVDQTGHLTSLGAAEEGTAIATFYDNYDATH